MTAASPSQPGGRRVRSSKEVRSTYGSTSQGLTTNRSQSRKPLFSRRVVRAGMVALAVLAAIAVVALWAVYRASQEVPAFYQRAIVAEPARQAAAGRQLERQAAALHNQARRPGRWEARFTQDQINGWLASDLPEKFPGSLPAGVSEPRVEIASDETQLAVKWDQGGVQTIVSLAGHVQLTEQPNEVAVRVFAARAGSIPVPLGQFLDTIAARAATSGIPLRWTEVEGDPVAIINLPLDQPEFRGKRIVVEELRVEEGVIVVAGRTDEAA